MSRRIGLRDQRISTGGGLAVLGGGCGPGGRPRQGPIAANRHLAKHAIGDRLGEPIGAGGRVMGPVGPEHRLRASLLDHPVQVIDGHAELAHDRGGRGVVPPHVGLGPVEVRSPPRVPLVQDRRRVGEDERGIRPFADAGDDPAKVLGVPVELDLMVPVLPGPLQVVQAAVQMHDVGLLPEDPLVEVGEHVGAVAAVLRRADDDRLAGEPRGDPGRSPGGSNRRRALPSAAPARWMTPPGHGSVGSPTTGQRLREELPLQIA